MADVVDWKRGDSFRVDELGMLIEDANGALTMEVNGAQVKASPLDMTGWTVASQMRRKDTDELVADLDFSWTDQATGKYSLQAKDTTKWPVTTLAWDVQFTDPSGFVTSSETKYFRIIKDQTRASA
jgi:hypothetical protein